MKGFCRQPGFRFMLDESICDLDDLSRAADIGVQFVKLKLYKHAGISHTLQLAQEANRLGLRVVFGNGVSTDVGNMAEALLWSCRPELFHGAFEGNGFAKLQRTVLDNPPIVADGCFQWSGSKLPDLRPTA